jgi:two-component system OmpR family sensor kinase
MERIEAEGGRMGLLVEDLLLLARMDQQRPLTFAPVDLADVAGDAVHDAKAVQPQRPISLHLDESLADVPVVIGDESRLRQVVGNLVTNALAAHGGSVELVTAPGEGAAFTVRLPRSGPPQSPSDGGAGDPA